MRRGFTLVEVIVVLIIVAVVAGATVPALARIVKEEPAATTARELMTVLRGAHRTALEGGGAVTVMVAPTTARYWILSGGGIPSDGFRTGMIPLETGVRLEGPSERVAFVFDARGLAHGDSIVVRHASSTRVVSVDRWRGNPYVH